MAKKGPDNNEGKENDGLDLLADAAGADAVGADTTGPDNTGADDIFDDLDKELGNTANEVNKVWGHDPVEEQAPAVEPLPLICNFKERLSSVLKSSHNDPPHVVNVRIRKQVQANLASQEKEQHIKFDRRHNTGPFDFFKCP